jgi:rubrerythrin
MKQITQKWWNNCLNNSEKLELWLVSLYNNEADAEERFKDFANTYCVKGSEEYELFYQIANEEANHAILVEKVLEERGIALHKKSSKNGRYFRNVMPCVVDRKTAAAIGAYAETLSLNRMRVIISDENTPEDLRKLFSIIEPDESKHVKILSKIATKYGIKAVKDCHDKGLDALGLKIKKSYAD